MFLKLLYLSIRSLDALYEVCSFANILSSHKYKLLLSGSLFLKQIPQRSQFSVSGLSQPYQLTATH